MKMAIATCAEKPQLTEGDGLLQRSLQSLGADVEAIVWNDAASLMKSYDGIVIRSVWDYHKNFSEFQKWIAKTSSHTKLINSASIIQWNWDKSYLLDLANKGISIVPSFIHKKTDDVTATIKQIRQSGWDQLVIKPTVSATAFLTYKCDLNSPETSEKIEEVCRHSDVLIQPYIESVTMQGEASLIFFNGAKKTFSHAVVKEVKKGDFRVQSDYGGRVSKLTPSASLIDFANAALSVVQGLWTFARVDVIDWQTRPKIGEIELIEPDLFLQMEPGAPEKLAEALLYRLSSN